MSKHVFFTGAAVGALVIGLAGSAVAANGRWSSTRSPGSAYDKQTDDWDVPLVAPEGFTQELSLTRRSWTSTAVRSMT